MPASKHTPQQKAAIVAAWRSSATGTTDQARFAREHCIAPRTLRAWLKKHSSPGPTGGVQDLLPALDNALQELQRLRVQVLALAAPPPQEHPLPRLYPGHVNLANVVHPTP